MNDVVYESEVRPESLLKFGVPVRLPIILQTEVAECGLACLAMISSYYGFVTNLIQLRRRFAISSHGTNLQELMSISSRMNFVARALRIDTEDLKHIRLPCVLHWGFNHFVVLKEIKKKKYIIHDPALGRRVIDEKSFGNEFTGIAMELIPSKDFKSGNEAKSLKISDFWSNISGFKRSIAQVLLLSLMLQVFIVISPFYMQTVVDDVLPRNDDNLLIVLALGFFLLLLIQTATSTLRSVVVLHLSNKLGIQMSANLYRHLIRLPMEYFLKRHMGDVVSRFGSLEAVRNVIANGLVAAIVDGFMAVITLTAMFFYDATLAFIVVFIVLLYALLRWAMYRPSQSLMEASIVAGAKEQTHFMESVRGIQTIKLFQKENERQNQWLNNLAEFMNKNIELARWGIGFTTLNGLLFGIENLLVVYFAATAVMGNVMSLGMMYGFMSYKASFVGAMDRFILQWMNYKMLDVHMARIQDITSTAKEDVDGDPAPGTDTSHHVSFTISGKIEAVSLSYRYAESEPFIFKDISFVIEAGESVVITGPSGCGKTTLLKCLMGLIEPTEGAVLVDGHLLKNVRSYREQIASVMQEDQLLTGDIQQNIACFSSQIDDSKVHYYAQMAAIDDEINKMPMKYHTLVGDMGSSLSGGQKQRVIFARALYREPRILFLDEATSHLDVKNEAAINNNLKNLPITKITIAHRPETILAADRNIDLSVLVSNSEV